MRKNSVHLQDFPDVSFICDEQELSDNMDLIREVCSTALAIRDSKNLRVRLPLQSLTLIGQNSDKILEFSEIIADEVNVKEIFTQKDFSKFADLKLQLNFKKIGAKFGPKIKEFTADLRAGKWQKISSNEIEISGEKLYGDEFELKLEVKENNDYAAMALPSNEFVVLIDTKMNQELINEGIARDLVRIVQQNRKDADLKITDKISLEIICSNQKIQEAVIQFQTYIGSQILANSIKFSDSIKNLPHQFKAKIDEISLEIGFEL